MSKKRKKKQDNIFFRIILIVITIIYGFYLSQIDGTYSSNKTTDSFENISDNLKISYLDVGQADAILVENNDEAMLIDAGNNEDGKLLVKYFNEQNITNFKYVIGTHPHEDHIGGLDDVINNFNIETIYMPDVITTSKTFMDVLDAIENNNMTYKVPKIEEEFYLGDAKFKVLYTGVDETDLNNTSIVLRLDFGNTSFLFTGDATEVTEKKLLKSNSKIDVDVLKVGHHGSKYSTTMEFLNKVSPKYAVISVGIENSYNHPESIVLNRLNNSNVDVYRTDLDGTIIITSDGYSINITNYNTNVDG